MTLNIDPKKRVALILRGIAGNFITAAEAIEVGDESKMYNWIRCGMNCMPPLADAIKMLHPNADAPKDIADRLDRGTEN